MFPLPRTTTQKSRRECVKSSGYGYGVLKRPTQLNHNDELAKQMEAVQIFEKSPINGATYSIVKNVPSMNQKVVQLPTQKELEFLVKKRSKEKFSEKLTHLDNQLKYTLQKSFKDLSVRPGNISCGVDGGYMKVI